MVRIDFGCHDRNASFPITAMSIDIFCLPDYSSIFLATQLCLRILPHSVTSSVLATLLPCLAQLKTKVITTNMGLEIQREFNK